MIIANKHNQIYIEFIIYHKLDNFIFLKVGQVFLQVVSYSLCLVLEPGSKMKAVKLLLWMLL